jgi:hypothetical protein
LKVSHVAVVPSSVSAKKEGEELLALRTCEGVSFNGKMISNLLLCLSKGGKEVKSNVGAQIFEGTEAIAVPAIISALWKGQIAVPRKDLFLGVNGKNLFLRCYKVRRISSLYLD